ncbi:hypothetical protein PV10_00539 [Exophiala mesophila]|uniref:Uncharacterized protein n=1 Tax=Exophiala mesophila TaxID=212818 RepID=A0A0D1ZQ15_EXOME|nr:uncharacterized protein PV10_00539 [Exophiala mesophila]KIV96712.1 hypothetical protein PV10_00539 [Exophiala mesophila]
MARNLPPNPLMAHQYFYQYAQLPVYQWRTYDRATLQYFPHSITPPTTYYPIYPYADNPYKPVPQQYFIHNDRPHTGHGIYRDAATLDGKPAEIVEGPTPKDDAPQEASSSTEATETSETTGLDSVRFLNLKYSNYQTESTPVDPPVEQQPPTEGDGDKDGEDSAAKEGGDRPPDQVETVETTEPETPAEGSPGDSTITDATAIQGAPSGDPEDIVEKVEKLQSEDAPADKVLTVLEKGMTDAGVSPATETTDEAAASPIPEPSSETATPETAGEAAENAGDDNQTSAADADKTTDEHPTEAGDSELPANADPVDEETGTSSEEAAKPETEAEKAADVATSEEPAPVKASEEVKEVVDEAAKEIDAPPSENEAGETPAEDGTAGDASSEDPPTPAPQTEDPPAGSQDAEGGAGEGDDQGDNLKTEAEPAAAEAAQEEADTPPEEVSKEETITAEEVPGPEAEKDGANGENPPDAAAAEETKVEDAPEASDSAPAAEEPAAEEPAAEEPAAEEPAAAAEEEVPAAEEPTAAAEEAPAAEEPASDAPAEEASGDNHVVEAAAVGAAVATAAAAAREMRHHRKYSETREHRPRDPLYGHKARLEREKDKVGLFENAIGRQVSKARAEEQRRHESEEYKQEQESRRERYAKRRAEAAAALAAQEEAEREERRAARRAAKEKREKAEAERERRLQEEAARMMERRKGKEREDLGESDGRRKQGRRPSFAGSSNSTTSPGELFRETLKKLASGESETSVHMFIMRVNSTSSERRRHHHHRHHRHGENKADGEGDEGSQGSSHGQRKDTISDEHSTSGEESSRSRRHYHDDAMSVNRPGLLKRTLNTFTQHVQLRAALRPERIEA